MTRRVRESELEAMRKRAEASEAHCERLRVALQRMVDEAAHLAGFSESTERAVLVALNETPRQSLADARAEAMIEVIETESYRIDGTTAYQNMREYANRIRRGEGL